MEGSEKWSTTGSAEKLPIMFLIYVNITEGVGNYINMFADNANYERTTVK